MSYVKNVCMKIFYRFLFVMASTFVNVCTGLRFREYVVIPNALNENKNSRSVSDSLYFKQIRPLAPQYSKAYCITYSIHVYYIYIYITYISHTYSIRN